MNITSTVFVTIGSMCLISITGGTSIYLTRIMLLTEESDDIFQFIHKNNKHSSVESKYERPKI